MGTNYYAVADACPHCGRGDGELHIGKSSYGWPFLFRSDDERSLTTWAAWRAFLEMPGVTIKDEYGSAVTPEELAALIEAKKSEKRFTSHERSDPDGYRFSIHRDFC